MIIVSPSEHATINILVVLVFGLFGLFIYKHHPNRLTTFRPFHLEHLLFLKGKTLDLSRKRN